MKRMKLSELTGNEILAQSLMTWDYQIILPEGVVLKKEYISSRDEIVNKKIRVYYHIEPIGKEYLEQTIIEFRKNMQGVFEIIAYGEGKKDE